MLFLLCVVDFVSNDDATVAAVAVAAAAAAAVVAFFFFYCCNSALALFDFLFCGSYIALRL